MVIIHKKPKTAKPLRAIPTCDIPLAEKVVRLRTLFKHDFWRRESTVATKTYLNVQWVINSGFYTPA